MVYSYKFRIYPNTEQQTLIQKTFGCARFVYNHFLAQRISEYNATGKSSTRFQQAERFSKQTGRTIILRLKFPDNAEKYTGHFNQARILYRDYKI